MYESTYFSEFLSAHPVTKALVSFLDLDRTGKMRIEVLCTLLLRCNHARIRPRTAQYSGLMRPAAQVQL
jgi:hypothetical protein